MSMFDEPRTQTEEHRRCAARFWEMGEDMSDAHKPSRHPGRKVALVYDERHQPLLTQSTPGSEQSWTESPLSVLSWTETFRTTNPRLSS